MEYPKNVRSAGWDVGLDFTLAVGGHAQSFRISREALEDHFGAGSAADDDGMLRAFREHFDTIAVVAAAKHGIPSNTQILLISNDFR